MTEKKADDKIRYCKRCGKMFVLDKHARKYCSPECQEAARLDSNRAAQLRWWNKTHPGQERKSYPYWAECKQCGAKFLKTSGAHVYCDKCAEERKRGKAIESNRRRYASVQNEADRENAERILARHKRAEEPKTWEWQQKNDHVCKSAPFCVYGAHDGCSYKYITGEFRSLNGEHQIINGKCDPFKRNGKKKRVYKK